QRENAAPQEQNRSSVNRSANPIANGNSGKRANRNPAFGNIGALMNDYDPKNKTGYLSTSFLGLENLDKSTENIYKAAIDYTYFYEEDERKGRKGVFVVTLVFVSKKE